MSNLRHWHHRQHAKQYRQGGKMNEENKVIIDVAAGTGTFAAWVGMMPDIVALFTGLWVLIRIWETDTVKFLTGRKDDV